MGLPSELVSQFAKIVVKEDPNVKKETTVYGTAVEYAGDIYVKIDGADQLTPISTTVDVKAGERVMLTIKNHTATVTGNMSSPAARTDDVKEVGGKVTQFETVLAYKVTTDELEAVNATIQSLRAKTAHIDNLEAINAMIENLEVKFANITSLTATDAKIINAEIENLQAEFGKFTDISTEDLEAINADIDQLKAYNANFTYVLADELEAVNAKIHKLDTDKLTAEQANLKYANIDFANIGEAAVKKILADSGLIRDIVVGDGTITGELVGVTIKGDLIEGGTVKADKLVVKGSDGLFYKLNFEQGTFVEGEPVPEDSLHGSVITANSITAEKINVHDLVAFDATIGGFNITDKSIYSGVKESADNSTRGIYMDKEGQFALGDETNFFKYFKDTDGSYKLEISSVKEASDELRDVIAETSTSIASSCSQIVLSALDNYVQREGKTIDTVTHYYLLHPDGNVGDNQTVTRETEGWVDLDTVVDQSPGSADYLWTYSAITFTDESVSYTEPALVGQLDGDIGLTYWFISYAVTDDGANPVGTEFDVSIPPVTVSQPCLWCRHAFSTNAGGFSVDVLLRDDHTSFSELKELVNAQLKVLTDQIAGQVTVVTERVEEVNGELQRQLTELTKYFTFDINGMTIGQVDSPYKVVIDNDEFYMLEGDREVLRIQNGEIHTPELVVDDKMEALGLLLEEDEEGTINCEYIGKKVF